MFGIKTLFSNQINQILYAKLIRDTFPLRGFPKSLIRLYLRSIHEDLKKRRMEYNLGWLYTFPHAFAVETYAHFLHSNPNNLGNVSADTYPPTGTRKLERQVIQKMIHLYHEKIKNTEGYITSGATESNLYSVWIGRKYLEQYVNKKTICVVKTNLTHYSIRKSADITGCPEFITPLAKEDWGMSPKGLKNTIHSLYRRGYRGFLIPLTIGYTATGTGDDINAITNIAQQTILSLQDCKIYFWIDAALNGLIEPFMTNNFNPFASPLVQTIAVDFHKLGLVPYPAGIILYRKSLRKLIEKPVDYFPETDSTVSGSRTGATAASIWTMISYFGKQGYRDLIDRQLQLKQLFVTQLKKTLPGSEIISLPHSVSCGVIFHSLKKHRLPLQISDKYGLYPIIGRYNFYPKTTDAVTIYKFFFLPHITHAIVREFFHDISSFYKNE